MRYVTLGWPAHRAGWVLAVGLAAAAALAGGCSKEEQAPPPANNSTAAGNTTVPTAAAGKKYRIAGVVFQEDQFFRLVQVGMRDAANRAGAELLQANTDGKPDKEAQLINTYVADKVDAIAISPVSEKASMPILKQASDKGIKVVVSNLSGVNQDFPVSFIESDQRELGEMTGKVAHDYIQKKLGGKARIGILAFKAQLPEQSNQRVEGFKKALADLPGVQYVAEQDAWKAEQAVSKAGDILTAHPDIDILWSANEGGTVGEVMAVKQAGKAGKVVVFGTDTSEQLANFLLAPDNILQAITGQQPYEIGSASVEAAIKSLKGEQVERRQVMPGKLLQRDKPDEVKAFIKRFQELTKGS